MPDIEYRIVYVVDVSRATRGLDQFLAKIAQVEARSVQAAARVNQAWANTAGIAKGVAGMKHLATQAGATEKAVAGVGKGNNSLTGFATRVDKATVALNAATAAAGTATPAMAGVGAGGPAGWRGGGGRAGGGGGAGIGGRAVAMAIGGAAIAGVRKVIGAVGESVAARREFQGDAADKAAQFRRELQSLSVLQDKTAGDEGLMREQIAFQKGSGQDASDAIEFRQEFGGAIAPGLALGNIDKKTAGELEKKAALFGKRYDIDPKSSGRMAGLLPMYQKVGTADQGLGEIAASAEFLNVYGLGTPRSQTPSMLALEADMLESEEGGRFGSMSQLAATFAATTFKARSPASAATQMRQTNRLLRRFGDDNAGQFLAQAGITPEDDYDTALRKIAPKVSGPDADLILKEAGFNNSTERASLMKQVDLIKVVDAARKDPRIAAARAEAGARNEKFKSTQTFKDALAENEMFGAEIETGIVGERLKTAKTAAKARLADPNQPGGQRLKAGLGQSVVDLSTYTWTGFGISGEDIRIDREAFAGLEAEGKKYGVDVRKMAPSAAYNADKGIGLDSAASRKEFNTASEAVDAKKLLIEGATKILQGANALGDQQGGRNGPPPPGDGGAGVVPTRR